MDQHTRPRIQRIGSALLTLPFAIALTVFFGLEFRNRPILAILPVVFITFWSGFYLFWEWLFFGRPERVKKSVPITSKEWRRRQKEFYDNLPR